MQVFDFSGVNQLIIHNGVSHSPPFTYCLGKQKKKKCFSQLIEKNLLCYVND